MSDTVDAASKESRKFDIAMAADYIKEALNLFSPEELGNIAYHLSQGHEVHAGPIAYKWSGVKSGCLITLATSRETLNHALDFAAMKRIDGQAMRRYSDLIDKIGLEFYIATAALKSSELHKLIVDFLSESGFNCSLPTEVTNEP